MKQKATMSFDLFSDNTTYVVQIILSLEEKLKKNTMNNLLDPNIFRLILSMDDGLTDEEVLECKCYRKLHTISFDVFTLATCAEKRVIKDGFARFERNVKKNSGGLFTKERKDNYLNRSLCLAARYGNLDGIEAFVELGSTDFVPALVSAKKEDKVDCERLILQFMLGQVVPQTTL